MTTSSLPQAITSQNWLEPPHHRTGLHVVEQTIPCTTISRGVAPPRTLSEAASPLDVESAAPGFLEATATDGFLVLKGDTVLHESYAVGNSATTRHIVMSVSKSLCGVLGGIVIEEGALTRHTSVTDLVPELAGGCYAGATVGQLLDMTAAPSYDMAYLSVSSEVNAADRAAGWRRRLPGEVAGIREHLASVRGHGEHGSGFQYCSASTEALAWALERATRTPYAELVSDRVWSRIGAEDDASITVDDAGDPYACAGMTMRLRDLARFGRTVLDVLAGTSEAFPASLVAEIRTGGDHPTLTGPAPNGRYKNQWWVPNDDHRSFYGVGIFGQYLWLDPVDDVVVAKLSSERDPVAHTPAHLTALRAIARAAGAQGA